MLQRKAAVHQWMKTAYVEPPKFDVQNLIAKYDFVKALCAITMKDKDEKNSYLLLL